MRTGRPEIEHLRSGGGGAAVEATALGARTDLGPLGGRHAEALVVAARRHQADRAGCFARIEDAAATADVATGDAADRRYRRAGRTANDAARAGAARPAGDAPRQQPGVGSAP